MNKSWLTAFAPTLVLLALGQPAGTTAEGEERVKKVTAAEPGGADNANGIEGLWCGSWGGGGVDGVVYQPVMAEGNLPMPRPVGWIVISVIGVMACSVGRAGEPEQDEGMARLAGEVRAKGWLVYSARSDNGTWDLFLSRPDGSRSRNITNTPKYEEAAPTFSRDGRKLLYRQLAGGSTINHDRWGFQGRLVIADADGANPVVVGRDGQWSWATWSPDGRQIACLIPQGIQIVELATGKVVRSMDREGIYQQLFWSPDGRWFCGTANHLGTMWTVARLSVDTGKLNVVHKFQSCTPDWFPDSKHVIFSSRPPGHARRLARRDRLRLSDLL